jgi:sugar-specific transcriptional regulator TrmB
MVARILEEIGLTKGEVAVYFALLEIGSSTVGPVVDKAKVSSSKVYAILERLIDKGLVSYIIKENRKHFEAASPKRILDYLKEREEEIKDKSKEIEKIMPQLLLKQKLSEKSQEVTIYEGVKGVKTAEEKTLQVLRRGQEFYFMGGSIFSTKKFKDYWQIYHKRRIKKRISTKILFNQNVSKSELDNRNQFKYCKAKYMPMEINTPSWIQIYKDTTIIGVPSDNPIAVEIKNKDVAESFSSYFKALWNQEITVREGIQGIKDSFNEMLDELKPGDEYYVTGASFFGDITKFADFFEDYHKRRISKGVRAKLLFVAGTEKLVRDHLDLYANLAEVKYLPEGIYEGIQFNLYNNKLIINVFREKEPIMFKIEDKDVYKTFKTYFDTLWKHDVKTLTGQEGIINLCEEVIGEKQALYLIGANASILNTHPEYFKEWDKRRVDAGIKRHHLSIEKTRGMQFNSLPNSQVRYLPEEFDSPMVIWVFGNKVAQVLWDKMIVFIIDNKQVADDYRNYFNLLWQSSKP